VLPLDGLGPSSQPFLKLTDQQPTLLNPNILSCNAEVRNISGDSKRLLSSITDFIVTRTVNMISRNTLFPVGPYDAQGQALQQKILPPVQVSQPFLATHLVLQPGMVEHQNAPEEAPSNSSAGL
jgi:hypothetical protein